MKAKISTFFQWFSRLFGVQEALFLAGLASFFVGMKELWSLPVALTVCGAWLMLIAVGSILHAQRTEK